MSNGSEALTAVLAATAISMIEQDKELIARLRTFAAEQGVPFDPDDISATLLNMASMDLLEYGRGLVSERPDDRDRHEHLHAVIPMQDVPGAATVSAEALSIASFTTEYVHAADGVFEKFCQWMDTDHPGAVRAGHDIGRGQVEKADKTLTTMAAVAARIADAKDGELRPRGDHAFFSPQAATTEDDGVRHV